MLALALLLDALFGEPDLLWNRVSHPVVLMGRGISAAEAGLNRGRWRREKGVCLVALLVLLGLATALALAWITRHAPFIALTLEVLGAAILLAQRSLVDHVRAVAEALARGGEIGLQAGRDAVARIVGRDTAEMDEPAIARAAIESAAENFSDGVAAPAFWFLIGGLPGMLIYKAVNTADSMIGYRSARYLEFGWAAARLDDVLNWVPARLSGLIFCLVGGGGRQALAVMRRDAGLHRSPNAGWPEAAAAASLGIALSGPRIYDGAPTDDPFVHPEGRQELTGEDITRACTVLWRAWALLLALALVWALI